MARVQTRKCSSALKGPVSYTVHASRAGRGLFISTAHNCKSMNLHSWVLAQTNNNLSFVNTYLFVVVVVVVVS